MSTPTYYQTLGADPSASHDQLRQSYRELARRLHPDRQTGATGAERTLAERRMREINQAWKVLGDRAARRRYDEALDRADRLGPGNGPRRPARPSAPPPSTGRVAQVPPEDEDDLVDVAPEIGPLGSVVMRGLPWVAVLGVLLVIFFITAYATGKSDRSPTRAPTARVGSCIRIDPGPVPVNVACDAPGALRVAARVNPLNGCPPGTELRRFQPDPIADCLEQP